MDNSFASRLRPRGCRAPNSTISSQHEDTPPSQDTRARASPSDNTNTEPSSSSSPPSSSSSSSSRPRLSSTTESRSNRRPHPYQRQTRSTANLPLPAPEDAPSPPPASSEVPPTTRSPSTISRRNARRSLDALSQQRLFLRRNLISSPRLSSEELSRAASSDVVVSEDDYGTSQRRSRGGGGGTRGRGDGSNARGGVTARIDSLRDRFQPTEARSRSSSASSIIRARLTARISFGQRLALSTTSSTTGSVGAGSVSLHATGAAVTTANNAGTVQAGTDRLTRNAARRAAEAIVDQRVASVPSLVDIDGASVAAARSEGESNQSGDPADRMGVLAGPGWSGTLDRTHGDEITVQIIDFGRIMGIPPYEIQLLNNLQGQFQDMLHRSFHHSITSRNFEDIPQRVVVEEDLEHRKEGGASGNLEAPEVREKKDCVDVGDASNNGETSSPKKISDADDGINGESKDDQSTGNATTPPDLSSSTTPIAAVASESRNCTICLMTPVVNDVLKTLPCDHFFHSDCLKQWFTDHASCPMCRDCALCRISGAFNVQFSPS